MTTTLIAGEPIEDLAGALLQFDVTRHGDGGLHLKAHMESTIGAPLIRALLRIEAELLLEEADAVTADGPNEDRTEEQRRADALLVLVQRIGDAMPPRPAGTRAGV
jgi:hypothetical protein